MLIKICIYILTNWFIRKQFQINLNTIFALPITSLMRSSAAFLPRTSGNTASGPPIIWWVWLLLNLDEKVVTIPIIWLVWLVLSSEEKRRKNSINNLVSFFLIYPIFTWHWTLWSVGPATCLEMMFKFCLRQDNPYLY